MKTAPCAPEILNMTKTNNSTYKVLFTTPNSPNTNYTITAIGRYDSRSCHSTTNSCELTQLPCGSTYEVMAVATTAVGRSLPGFSKTLETGILNVMSNLFYLCTPKPQVCLRGPFAKVILDVKYLYVILFQLYHLTILSILVILQII